MSSDSQKNSLVPTAGFFVAGTVFGSMGPLLVAGDLFLDSDPVQISARLLAFGAGYGTGWIGARLGSAVPPVVWVGALTLAWVVDWRWPVLGMAAVGALSAALLTRLLVEQRVPEFAMRTGAVVGAATLCASYFDGLSTQAALWLGIYPLILLCTALRRGTKDGQAAVQAATVHGRGSFAGALFSTLVFVQSGCEWGLAIWLPIYFIRVLGSSPWFAILLDALYLGLLVVGRRLAARFFGRRGNRRALLIAFAAALAGCVVLSGSSSVLEAVGGMILIAYGFGPVYTVSGSIARERRVFSPRLYPRLFFIGVAGAVSFGCLLAGIDDSFGLRALPLLPLIGSTVVAVLELLLMFEKHLMGSGHGA